MFKRASLPLFQSAILLTKSKTSLFPQRSTTTMAGLGSTPYEPQRIEDIQSLLRGLEESTKKESKEKRAFSGKRTTFPVEGSDIKVNSWRFQDWDYKRSDLPTYARGLFTSKNEKGQPEIVIRGYDKFFNQEEVNETKWRNIETNTKGPYELSLKENGCIIFISGLHDGSLLVCSKHSTGPRRDDELSHAMAGERWINKHLASVGKTREQLARELRKRNATAVAELCDDEFEEHILAYGKDAAGLYLHGININLPEFMTYSGAQVHGFADEWGFRRTDFLVIEDLAKTKSFLEEVANTGSYEGRDVEGFVIRCKARRNGKGAYEDWFFKYKFEEPYLLYRQWREFTKMLISGKTPHIKKHVAITEEYLLYARRKLAENKTMAQEYAKNHGIIKLRDDFLKEKNLKGSDIIRLEYAANGGPLGETDRNVILVPIATLGCGKTTLAVALQHLFGWGHVQNDNIIGKNRPPRFTRAVTELLENDVPVVFADRNNSGKQERAQILDGVHRSHPHVRLVALNFPHTPETLNKIREVTQGRVIARGDNHQTIQAASDEKKVIGIMEGFIYRFDPVREGVAPDDGFDVIIDLDPTAQSRRNLETLIGQLHNNFPKLFTEMPTSEDLDEAIKFALSDYKPDVRHTIPDRGSKHDRAGNQKSQKQPHKQQAQVAPQPKVKKHPLEYISVALPTTDVRSGLDKAFGSVPIEQARFFRQLDQSRRVQPDFHVTLIHRASSKAHPQLWKKYSDMHAEKGEENKLGDCKVVLERVSCFHS